MDVLAVGLAIAVAVALVAGVGMVALAAFYVDRPDDWNSP